MTSEFDQLLDAATQTALADEIVAATAAVVADLQAPDFAASALARNHEQTLQPNQIGPAAALQAYGVGQSGALFAAALTDNPVDRADALRQLLSSAGGAEQALAEDDGNALAFKSRLCTAIAMKAADLVAAELLRDKQAPLAIDNPADAAVFRQKAEAQHQRHVTLLKDYLQAIPQRYPAFADRVLPTLAQQIRRDIAERYQSTGIRQVIDGLLHDALGDVGVQAGGAH